MTGERDAAEEIAPLRMNAETITEIEVAVLNAVAAKNSAVDAQKWDMAVFHRDQEKMFKRWLEHVKCRDRFQKMDQAVEEELRSEIERLQAELESARKGDGNG